MGHAPFALQTTGTTDAHMHIPCSICIPGKRGLRMPICIYHAPFAFQGNGDYGCPYAYTMLHLHSRETGTTDAHMHIPCSICIPRKRGLRMPICIYHAAFVFEKNGDYGCPYAYTMLHSYFKKMGIT